MELLSFIKANETWAIVGDSRSGNSELLQSIEGKEVELVSARHHFRNLSNTTDFYYQQRFNSADSEDALTVHDYLHKQQVLNGSSHWDYAKVIKQLHLENLLSEEIIKLSNGETRRLLIAAALIRNPGVLLLDQPLTGLDKNTRAHFDDLLKKIIASGIRVIIATNPEEVPRSATHVAVMKDGKLVFTGTRHDFDTQHFDLVHTFQMNKDLLSKLVSAAPIQSYSTIIKMRDVNVVYDGRKILQNINWHVKQGERWSLSGSNGAGKSTLLSLVNADNPQAYANNIILFDRQRGSGESIWDIKRQTGYVSPELYQYFPMDSSCMHVIESGFYDTVGLFRPSDPDKEQVCTAWMKLLQIDLYANKLFSMVPASIQRLCLLARALIKNPALLILDEPTQGLDTSQQKFFTSLIDHICSISNVTVIYVSHYDHHIPHAVTHHFRLENGRHTS